MAGQSQSGQTKILYRRRLTNDRSVLALTVAAECAAERSDVHGSGTFLPALIDELYNLKPETLLSRAKVQVW